jgi:hypothetical protein
MNRLLIFLLILLSFIGQSVLAYYPKVKLDFQNIKMKRTDREELQKDLLEFLTESPEVLKPEHKRYKEDQYCRYEMDTDPESKNIKLETIKVLDDKENLSYNLKIIEFLRLNPDITIKKRDEEKPVEIEFKYLAF